MIQVRVGMLPFAARGQIGDENPLRHEVPQGELLELALHIDDALAVGGPARIAGTAGHKPPVSPVHVHAVDVASGLFALARIDEEADLRAVGRDVWVEFIHVRRAREVPRADPSARTTCRSQFWPS